MALQLTEREAAAFFAQIKRPMPEGVGAPQKPAKAVAAPAPASKLGLASDRLSLAAKQDRAAIAAMAEAAPTFAVMTGERVAADAAARNVSDSDFAKHNVNHGFTRLVWLIFNGDCFASRRHMALSYVVTFAMAIAINEWVFG